MPNSTTRHDLTDTDQDALLAIERAAPHLHRAYDALEEAPFTAGSAGAMAMASIDEALTAIRDWKMERGVA